VLKDAGLTAEELDGVILVGGSTRSPVVRDYVKEIFGREPLCDLDPDQVVALGAAVQAEVLAGGEQQVVLLDVVPLSLGIETMGGVVEKLVARNTTIPCGANQTFTTYADNQTGFDIHVLQGERETVDACRSLAKFTLRGIPPMVAGMARVEITFLVDADGILHVTAKELTSGKEASIDVKPSYGLTDEEVERMLVESFEHADDDLRRRNLQVERVEADRILAATRGAFDHDDGLMPRITFKNPQGAGSAPVTFDIAPRTTILEAAEEHGVRVGHACGGNLACSTCHVRIEEGFDSLGPMEDKENDILDKAFDVRPESRLGCQCALADEDVVVEITEESLRAWLDENPDVRKREVG
jgi:ferredoxin